MAYNYFMKPPVPRTARDGRFTGTCANRWGIPQIIQSSSETNTLKVQNEKPTPTDGGLPKSFKTTPKTMSPQVQNEKPKP